MTDVKQQRVYRQDVTTKPRTHIRKLLVCCHLVRLVMFPVVQNHLPIWRSVDPSPTCCLGHGFLPRLHIYIICRNVKCFCLFGADQLFNNLVLEDFHIYIFFNQKVPSSSMSWTKIIYCFLVATFLMRELCVRALFLLFLELFFILHMVLLDMPC